MAQNMKKQIYMWPSYWGKPVAHGSMGAVSCNNIYATRAGLEILNKGGNAFDAAVAVSLTLSVVEPHHSGIGGGCFSLLYDAKTGKTQGIDGRGIAPAKATADLFIKDGEVQDEWKDLGGQSVALPGLLKTMDIVLKKYGTMTLKDVAAPAIRCARNGFGTSYTGALTMYDNSVERKMRLSEAFRKLYLKEDGSFYRFGEIQKNQEIADLLENIAEQGVDYFYKGKVAKQIVDLINDRGGCFDVSDMESYEPKFREPVKTTYRGYEVAAFAPPSGGCALVEMLNILENYDVRSMGHNTAASIHALTESMKLGFADRSVALGDPDFVNVDVERLTSKKFAHERFTLAGEKAGEFASADGIEAKQYPGNTSHFVVMDKDGNAFSQTQTIRDWFGCGIVVDGLGFVLNNAMSDFSAAVGAMTSQGLAYGSANAIQGGKTPLSSMSPSMVFKDGKPFLAIGAAGGPRIITGTLQGIVNAIDFDMTPEQLVNAPYINCLTRAQGLEVEYGISGDTRKILEEMGHKIVPVPVDQAMSTMLNSVMCIDGEFYAAGTKRVDGCGGALLPGGHIVLEGVSQEEL
ncbi:gamma-glutamyltransferase [Clostridium sp. AM30-24]|nr:MULTISPECIES: gamma-glutamyltransferase [unclassified Clostridium]RHS24958.1 gamma-glutamyltransferase [Clostridium sp. AF12-28]RHS30185.1 gamma-glutamyltransferase [Clostridium sp. AF12-19]RHT42707.1 gamma-glutamyltransferase [Clostridium sp. AM30-24]